MLEIEQYYTSPYPPTSGPPYQPAYVSPYPPVYTSPYAPVNTAPGGHSASGTPPANTARRRHPANITSQQGSNTARDRHLPQAVAPADPSQQGSSGERTDRPYTTPQTGLLPRLPWDAQADAFALAEHRTGKSVQQIKAHLGLNGYDILAPEITASLHRQGVDKVNWEAMQASPWDARADAFALAAYEQEQTASQIAMQLCKDGFEAPIAKVVASLNRQGVIQLGLPAFASSNQKPYPWDSKADGFAITVDR